MSSRQLSFVDLPRSQHRPQPPKRAKRDWSKAEFYRELRHYGFESVGGGISFRDLTGVAPAATFEPLYARNPIRVRRRATLAKILRERDRLIQELAA
jgi:hypothetical protein